jgi:cysteine dioxygenase
MHDHADAHCLMKVLKGTLKETRFDFPKNNTTPLVIIKETVYRKDQVTYMADELGLHKISNPDPMNIAVSLHRKLTPFRCLGPRAEVTSSLHTTKRCTIWM